MRTIFWFLTFGFYQLITLIYIVKYNRLGKQGKDKQLNYVYSVASRWAKHMIRLSGSTVEVHGLENVPDEPVLFVSNHQSNFDIPLIMGYIPKFAAFVAKVELEHIPIVSGWMRRMGCLFLDRSNPRKSLIVLKKGITKLKNGETLVIFPEGTRSKSKTMGEFKKGSLHLALKSGVPIVPLTVDGTYKLLEENNRIRKGHVKLTIHEPINTKDLSKEEKESLNDAVKAIIQSPLA